MTLIPAVLRPTNSGLPPTASRLTWDFENKLIAADTDNDSMDDIFYKFDALGRRVGRDDGTANVVYFQDGQQTIADYPSGTAAGSPTYTYVYASYIDEPVMRGGSGGLRYYHRNQQYSITTVSDGGGAVVERYAYSAYGQAIIADGAGSQISNSGISNRYTYTGREWDEGLGLYHYRARMYDAVGGRFVSQDPVGFRGSPWLLFEYAAGNPLRYTDYAGLQAREPRGQVQCDIEGGGAPIMTINVTTPSRVCTERHERVHVGQFTTGDSCCEKSQEAYRNASNRRAKQEVMREWNRWTNQAITRSWFECPAFEESVKCAVEHILEWCSKCPPIEFLDRPRAESTIGHRPHPGEDKWWHQLFVAEASCKDFKRYLKHAESHKKKHCDAIVGFRDPTCPH
jgi:RHS repeat-associated protein